MALLDKGNGFLDRFLICIPRSYRPLPQEQIQATEKLRSYVYEFIKDIYTFISIIDETNPLVFYFDDDALKYAFFLNFCHSLFPSLSKSLMLI